MGYRISVDVGGTFTDLTLADEAILLGRHKSPTTPEDLTQGVLNCLTLAGRGLNIGVEEILGNTDVFIHSSTTATNAILEDKGVKCGVICTRGTKYTLWRGEGRRQDIYNYKVPPPKPLVRPYLCLEVSERIDRDGEILVTLDEGDVRAAVRQFKEWNVKVIAVCLLWSIVNPIHEQRIGEIIKEEWPDIPFSLSFEIQPIIREYHRMSCVTLNAMVQPIVTEYLQNLQNALSQKGFKSDPLIVISSGGVVPIKEVMKKPVFMLFSGPSMGPVSGLYYAEQNQEENSIVIDMGGTSFDVSTVIKKRITTTREGRINNYPTGVAANEILTLGAGGGSIAWVDPAGILNVGPRSSGAIPGPACYLRGGTEPTVTDACVALGYIVPDFFLGGQMEISPEQAQKAIREKIADPLNLSVEAAALGICQVTREKMVGGILNMTVRRGIDPREFILVLGGGATGLFAAGLAEEINVKRVIIPKETAELCAFGALNADISMSSIASKYTDSNDFNYEEINQVLGELEKKGEAFLERLGVPSETCEFEFYTSARYPMQVTELEIPLDDKVMTPERCGKLVEIFHDAHLARYKTADPGSSVEFVMWRSVARRLTPGISLEKKSYAGEDPSRAVIGKQRAFFGDEKCFIETSCYDGELLSNGMKVDGPAIVVLLDTTVVVPKRFTLSVEEHDYYVMEAL
ncbi:MAG: hydantoinase/oxoprolinase family protein [Deltaproteobacteria bacterium]|jgi:N-methylhydantoinase A|nr:hydantoinase/oxoprolinase family protein [Deltaproteobacteria bacterium]